MKMENYISNLVRKSVLVASAVCVSSLMASAVVFPSDGGTLLANTVYTFEAATPVASGVFVPSTTGSITYTTGNYVHPYFDADHINMNDDRTHVNYNDGGTYAINVTKGVPVYFYCEDTFFAALGNCYFLITESLPIEITDYTTQPGEVLSITSGFQELRIYANQPIHASGATISIDGTDLSSRVVMSTINSNPIDVPYVSVLQNWFNTGALKGGEGITITISGIVNANGEKYNNGEDLVLHYIAPQKAINLREVTTPNPFYSYWRPGDPAALLTATYTGEISKATYELVYGTFEAEIPDGYLETGSSENPDSKAKVTVNGNTVTIDFAGYQRRPQDMVPSGTNYGTITVKVTAYDTDGNKVAGEGQGQVGSFDRAMTYVPIKEAQLNTQFVPAPGSDLKGVKELKVTLYDYETLDFTGVKFEIENGPKDIQTVIVPKSELSEVKGNGSDWTITVPVPAAVQNTDKKVVVTFDELSSTDGYDHSNDIRAVYNGFTITWFEMSRDGVYITDRTLEYIYEDTEILVTTNVDDQYPDLYMEYQIDKVLEDGTFETVKTNVWMNKGEDAGEIVYTQTVPMDIKLVKGYEYHLTFTAWPSEAERYQGADDLGSEYIVLRGATEPFRFSSITLVSVTPENETEIPADQTEFTLVYDGLVKINEVSSFIKYGQGMTVPFKSITPIDPQEGYSNTWILTIPDTYIAGYRVSDLDLTIVATDENGLLVEGNFGEEENNFLALHYPIEGAGLTDNFEVTPGDGKVESLQYFTISSSQPVGVNWNSDEQITFYDRSDRQHIYTFNNAQVQLGFVPKPGVTIPEGVEEGNETYYLSVVQFSLPNPITEKGTYILTIPENFLIIGSQFDTAGNENRQVVYEIGEYESVEFTVTPEEGTVEELSTVELYFPNGASMGEGKTTLVINGGEPIVLNDPEMLFDFEDWSAIWVSMTYTLPETYTEDGTYEIHIPAGFFTTEAGECDAIDLTYYIGISGIDKTYGETSVNVYTIDGRQLVKNGSADDIKALNKGLYIINGKKVILK